MRRIYVLFLVGKDKVVCYTAIKQKNREEESCEFT